MLQYLLLMRKSCTAWDASKPCKYQQPFGVQGNGLWPDRDWEGTAFSDVHFPEWYALAGSELCGGWRGVVDGYQGDQEFLHKIFRFQRTLVGFLCLNLICL